MTKVIKEFVGVADGEHHPRTWQVGDEVPEGTDLERVALEEGWCEKMQPAPKNKAMAPKKNKSGAASQVVRPSQSKTLKRSKKKA